MALVTPSNVTGYSGFWQSVGPSTAPYQLRFGRSNEEYQAAVVLGKPGFRRYRAVMRALNGVAPGATATDSYRRVQAIQNMNDAQYGGGLRPTQVVVNNTVTTTPMRDAINTNIYDRISKVVVYPRDLGGNGGGGKVGR